MNEIQLTNLDRDTKRFLAAAMAVPGWLASGEGWAGDDLAKETARRAVVFADALLEALQIKEDKS